MEFVEREGGIGKEIREKETKTQSKQQSSARDGGQQEEGSCSGYALVCRN